MSLLPCMVYHYLSLSLPLPLFTCGGAVCVIVHRPLLRRWTSRAQAESPTFTGHLAVQWCCVPWHSCVSPAVATSRTLLTTTLRQSRGFHSSMSKTRGNGHMIGRCLSQIRRETVSSKFCIFVHSQYLWYCDIYGPKIWTSTVKWV